jgi:hypothetical protein
LNWFLDSSHIQKKATNLIFYKIINNKNLDNRYPDFGILLNKFNVEEFIIKTHSQVKKYNIEKFDYIEEE